MAKKAAKKAATKKVTKKAPAKKAAKKTVAKKAAKKVVAKKASATKAVKKTAPAKKEPTVVPEPTHEEICIKAEEIYRERMASGAEGSAETDWFSAVQALKGGN